MLKLSAFLRAWGPSILVMGIIFCFSTVPGPTMPNFGLFDFLVKKGGHATGYALLALCNLRGVRRDLYRDGQGGPGARSYVVALLIAVLYAATDEFHQSFIPGRHPLVSDVGIDTLGASAGLGLWTLYHAAHGKSSPVSD